MNIVVSRKSLVGYDNNYDKFYVRKNSSLFFGVSFAVFLVVMILRTSFFSHMFGLDREIIYKLLMLGCICMLMLKEYIVEKHYFVLVIQLCVIMALVLLVKKVDSFTAATSLFFLYSCRNEDFEYIAKIALAVTTVLLGLVIVSSLIGIIPNYEFDLDTERPRYFLGFGYALFAPAYLFNVVALVFYLKKDKVNMIIILMEFLACYYIYKKTDSRLSFGFTILLILASLAVKIPFRKFKKRIRYIYNPFKALVTMGITLTFVICAFVSIAITVKYDSSNELHAKINSIFAQRLYFGQKSYQEYGIKPFGQRINWVGNGLDSEGNPEEGDYLYVDNLYLQFLQRFGYVVFCIIMLLLSYSMYRMVKEKAWIMIIIMILIAGHAMVDDLVLHLWYNTFWLVLIPYFVHDSIKIKKKQ